MHIDEYFYSWVAITQMDEATFVHVSNNGQRLSSAWIWDKMRIIKPAQYIDDNFASKLNFIMY